MKSLSFDNGSVLVSNDGKNFLFDIRSGINKCLSDNKIERIDAVFINKGFSGIEELKQFYIDKKYEAPIPTYMSQDLMPLLQSGQVDFTHLDVTTIKPDTISQVFGVDVYLTPKGTFFFDEKMIEMSNVFELARQAFGSPGGKKNIAKKLVSVIPKHEVYVEPFAGGAAVFFNKEKSNVEVLNDKSNAIINSYLFLQRGDDRSFAEAESYLQHPVSKSEFFRLRDSVESGTEPTAKGFTDFFKVNYYSFGMDRRSYGYIERTPSMNVASMRKLQERLKDVKIYCSDAVEVLKKYDGENTFVYLDPPYPDNWRGKKSDYTYEHFDRLLECLKSMKGKFMLSINNSKSVREKIPKEWKVTLIKTRRNVENRAHVAHKTSEYELIVSNYPLIQEVKNG